MFNNFQCYRGDFPALPKPAVVAAVSKKYNPVKPMNCVRSASCNGNRIYLTHIHSQPRHGNLN